MNLEKLKPSVASTIVYCFGIFFLVVVAIFLLNRPLFFTLNMWQMIGIGVGISIPILVVNTFILDTSDASDKKRTDEDRLKILSGAALTGIFFLTFILLIFYWTSEGLKFYFTTVVVTQLAALIWASISAELRKRKKNKSLKTD